MLNVPSPVQHYFSNLTYYPSNRTQPTSFTPSLEFVATDEDLEEVLEEKLDREPKTVSAKNLEMCSEMGSEMDLEESSEDTAEEGSGIVSEVVSEPEFESDSQSEAEIVCKDYSDAG